jgi:hypothetical protein
MKHVKECAGLLAAAVSLAKLLYPPSRLVLNRKQGGSSCDVGREGNACGSELWSEVDGSADWRYLAGTASVE